MDHPAELCSSLFIIFQRMGVCVGLLHISLGRRDPVHEHLYHIPRRHLLANDPLFWIGTVVDPVFIMMPVPPFMVQPRGRISGSFPLCIVRASRSLVIFAAHEELRRRIFWHIVQQTLLIQSNLKTLFHHQHLMVIDRTKMLPCFHNSYSTSTY